MRGGFSLIHAVREPLEPSSDPAPVLLLLHGLGSNEQDLMSLASALDPRFFVVSARAPIALQHGSYAWYRVQFAPREQTFDAEEEEASRICILQFVDQIVESYNIDSNRIYMVGFSQGCIMSLRAGLTEPRRFAGIVGMSGRLLPGASDKVAPHEQLAGLPVLIVHGTEDSVLSIEYGRAIRDYLEKLPVSLTYREYPMGHHISEESFADIERWLAESLDAHTDWRAALG